MQIRGQSWRRCRRGKRLETPQRLLQFCPHRKEVAAEGALTTHEHVVVVGAGGLRDHLPCYLAQAAADPIPDNSIAHLAADREADPDGRKGEFGRDKGCLKHEAGHGTPPPGLDA